MDWFTSDWHFCHNKPFIYAERGFQNVYNMNSKIIENYNSIIKPWDDVYCLGDCMLNNNELGIQCIKQLKGKIHIIRGNHCTDERLELYKKCFNVVEVCDAAYYKFNKKHFYLSHYPTYTTDKNEHKKHPLINLYGHTHQTDTNFFNDNPYMYHVGIDSHNLYPISIEQIISDIERKINETNIQ